MNYELANYMKQGLRLLLMTNAISTASADEILIALYDGEAADEPIIARILHETERAFCLDILYKSVWLGKRMLNIQEKHDDVIVFTLRVPEIAKIKEIIP